MKRSRVWQKLLVCTFLSIHAASGCTNGNHFPVSGKVVDQAGQPIPGLEGSEIVFSQTEGNISSVGEIKADGTYTMFTESPGDGVPPGEYKVYIPRRRMTGAGERA